MFLSFWRALARKKRTDDVEVSKLARVLNLIDLTALGVGSTLGLGAYVLAGQVAYDVAGPAVVISFLVAAIASAFAGLCYAEFAARVPRAGSAYVYSYVSIGEFVAFSIGWNLILEYVIGTSSVARGLSGYFDSLIDNSMKNFFRETMPIDVSFLADYPDFFAFGVIILLTSILAFGVKESTFINNVFTVVNMATIVTILVAGGINSKAENWTIDEEDVPKGGVDHGTGGFAPFGFAGIMAGAATCFYGFVGFDCIATTGEEAINPRRNIPLSIVISLIIIFLAYFGLSTVLTMCVPYFDLEGYTDAPFPYIFDQIGWTTVRWIVSIGAVFALCTSLLGAMFPLPRVIYAMSTDGLLYKIMKRVNERTKTPLMATFLAGLLAAVMALAFNLSQLIDMMSIGTLMAYTIVAICVLILHYESYDAKDETSGSWIELLKFKSYKNPTKATSNFVKFTICVYFALAALLSGLLKLDFNAVTITFDIIVAILMLLTAFLIGRQPKDDTVELSFKVPLVPFLPCLSVFMNVYLMFQLDLATWIRFIVWIVIGYIIYFTYGIRNSVEGKLRKIENNSTKKADDKY